MEIDAHNQTRHMHTLTHTFTMQAQHHQHPPQQPQQPRQRQEEWSVSRVFSSTQPICPEVQLTTAPRHTKPHHVVQAHHRLTLSPSLIHTEETTNRFTSSLYASTLLLATLALLWIHCTPVLTLCTMYCPMLLHTLSHRQRSWRVSSSVAFFGL